MQDREPLAKPTDHNAPTPQEERLEQAVRQAEARSAEDHAALERVRRKLTRLMLVSLAVTFIALMIVALAIIYKIAHTGTTASPKTGQIAQAELRQNAAGAKRQAEQATKLPPIFIQTAPNSGAEAAFAREKQQAEKTTAIEAITPENQKLPLKPGEILVSESLNGTLLLLRTTIPDAQQNETKTMLIIYDFSKGKVLTRIRISNDAGSSTN